MSESNLVTTYSFNGREYLVKMSSVNNCLELVVTDKSSGEEWQCSYDMAYIETVTQKTGNYKQFDIFIAMLKSGLLKTSDCVSLDFLTIEDLDMLRTRKVRSHCVMARNNQGSSSNRRYLILTYCVEFDRIHYPLPLEYCGLPDPRILQVKIRKLESELQRLRENGSDCSNSVNKQVAALQKRVDDLTSENVKLRDEIRQLRLTDKKPRDQAKQLHKAIRDLEKSVLSERKSHHQLVEKLRGEKAALRFELEKLRTSEKSLLEQIRSNTPRITKSRVRTGANKPNVQISDPGFRRTVSRVNQQRPHSESTVYPHSPRLLLDSNRLPNRSLSRTKHIRSSSESSRSSGNTMQNILRLNLPKDTPRRPSPSISNRSRSGSASTKASNWTSSSDNSEYQKQRVRKKISPRKSKTQASNLDFRNLESRIHTLQQILREGLSFQ